MCNQNDLPEIYLLRNIARILKKTNIEISDKLLKLYRMIAHITRVEHRKFNNILNETSNTDTERIFYIHKEFNKEDLKKALYLKDKKRRKVFEIIQVYDLIINIGKDVLNGIINYPSTDNEKFIKVILEQFDIFDNLIVYCNNQFKIISASYSCVTPFITFDNINFVESQKHNMSILIEDEN